MRGLSGSAWQRGRVAVWWLGLGLRPPCAAPVGGAQPGLPMKGGEGRTCKSNPPGVSRGRMTLGTKVENMPPQARFDQAPMRRLERAAVPIAFVHSAPSLLSPDAERRSGSWCWGKPHPELGLPWRRPRVEGRGGILASLALYPSTSSG